MDVGKYKAVTKPLVVEFEGDVINIAYRPNVFSLGLQRRLVEAQKAGDVKALTEQMTAFIASWDLEEEGQQIPLTAEGIERVPADVLKAIDDAIAAALLPSDEEKKGSSEPSPSQQADSIPPSESSPSSAPTSSNGSETSALPTVSESVPSS